MKVYKDYFKQILTGLMHILIEHSDLLRCHIWDFGFFIQVRSTMKHNELNCRNLYTIDFYKIKNEKDKPVCVEKDYILPNFKLQFSHNIFPRMSVCQNSDEIKATDQHNIRMSLVFFFLFLFLFFVFVFKVRRHRLTYYFLTVSFFFFLSDNLLLLPHS